MVRAGERILFVEGGGDNNASLASECRKAFSQLFANAGITRRPRVVACGGRKSAYNQFCNALEDANSEIWLLVDAEDLPPTTDTIGRCHQGYAFRDIWERPALLQSARQSLSNEAACPALGCTLSGRAPLTSTYDDDQRAAMILHRKLAQFDAARQP